MLVSLPTRLLNMKKKKVTLSLWIRTSNWSPSLTPAHWRCNWHSSSNDQRYTQRKIRIERQATHVKRQRFSQQSLLTYRLSGHTHAFVSDYIIWFAKFSKIIILRIALCFAHCRSGCVCHGRCDARDDKYWPWILFIATRFKSLTKHKIHSIGLYT